MEAPTYAHEWLKQQFPDVISKPIAKKPKVPVVNQEATGNVETSPNYDSRLGDFVHNMIYNRLTGFFHKFDSDTIQLLKDGRPDVYAGIMASIAVVQEEAAQLMA